MIDKQQAQKALNQIISIVSNPIPDMAMARDYIIEYCNKLQQVVDDYELYKKAYKRACQDLADDCCKNCANNKPRNLYESGEEIEKNILKIIEKEN